jgi:hypothetical protein
MNLTRDQENVLKSAAEALTDWRDELQSVAWLILGLLLVAGLIALAGAWLALWRRRRRAPDDFRDKREGGAGPGCASTQPHSVAK